MQVRSNLSLRMKMVLMTVVISLILTVSMLLIALESFKSMGLSSLREKSSYLAVSTAGTVKQAVQYNVGEDIEKALKDLIAGDADSTVALVVVQGPKGDYVVKAKETSKEYGAADFSQPLKELGNHPPAKPRDVVTLGGGKLEFVACKIDLTSNAAIQNGYVLLALSDSRISHRMVNTALMMAGIGLLIMLFGVLIALFISRTITKPVLKVIAGLLGGAEQVASASSEVSSSCQSLAEGASEQAASIEETSSSLEEMASMTKRNADNSNQANRLMNDTKETVALASVSMEKLTHSMGEISRASDDTSKIIKTIDEIAFQTNLLALNAAVEAARAGEAGAGFAVVADEVRNLAMRAAEAARNTADLIEGTVRRVKEGAELLAETNGEFNKVAAEVEKSGELIGEISAASQEQAQGIGQVNKAVCEIDRVVQQNAANAEESASASEEMNAQAHQMKDFVAQLKTLVEGSRASKTVGSNKVAAEGKSAKNLKSMIPEKKFRSHSPGGTENNLKFSRNGESLLKRSIPFENSDF